MKRYVKASKELLNEAAEFIYYEGHKLVGYGDLFWAFVHNCKGIDWDGVIRDCGVEADFNEWLARKSEYSNKTPIGQYQDIEILDYDKGEGIILWRHSGEPKTHTAYVSIEKLDGRWAEYFDAGNQKIYLSDVVDQYGNPWTTKKF